jgi:hypothetical protein
MRHLQVTLLVEDGTITLRQDIPLPWEAINNMWSAMLPQFLEGLSIQLMVVGEV